MAHADMLKIYILIMASMFSAAAFAGDAAASSSEKCINAEDLKKVKSNVLDKLPDISALPLAVDPKFTLMTNVRSSLKFDDPSVSAAQKLDWLGKFLQTQAPLFSGFHFARPVLSYMKDNDVSVNNIRIVRSFPKNQCVYELQYNLDSGPCLGGDKLQGFSLIFNKDHGAMVLSEADLYFLECEAPKGAK